MAAARARIVNTKSVSLLAVAGLAPGLVVAAPAAQAATPADLVITELAYGGNASGVYANDTGDGEYVELTNIGGTAQDVSGWHFDTSTSTTITTPSPSAGVSLSGLDGGSTVQPGESVIITDLSAADFRTEWGLKSTVKVVSDG